MHSNSILLALAIGAAPMALAQRTLRAFTDGNGAATQCSGGYFTCTIERGRCCFLGGSVVSGGYIENSQFSDFITLQVRTDFDPDSGCGSAAATGTGSMCISAGIDGANAIRWEEGSLRTNGASETPDEEQVRPDSFKFSEDGPSLDLAGMNDEELVELVSFVRGGGSAETLPTTFAARLRK